jgi:hypothetical protein
MADVVINYCAAAIAVVEPFRFGKVDELALATFF